MTTLQVRIAQHDDPRGFRAAVAHVKELGGKFDAGTKTWAFDVDKPNADVRVKMRAGGQYEGLDVRGTILEALGSHVEVV